MILVTSLWREPVVQETKVPGFRGRDAEGPEGIGVGYGLLREAGGWGGRDCGTRESRMCALRIELLLDGAVIREGWCWGLMASEMVVVVGS